MWPDNRTSKTNVSWLTLACSFDLKAKIGWCSVPTVESGKIWQRDMHQTHVNKCGATGTMTRFTTLTGFFFRVSTDKMTKIVEAVFTAFHPCSGIAEQNDAHVPTFIHCTGTIGGGTCSVISIAMEGHMAASAHRKNFVWTRCKCMNGLSVLISINLQCIQLHSKRWSAFKMTQKLAPICVKCVWCSAPKIKDLNLASMLPHQMIEITGTSMRNTKVNQMERGMQRHRSCRPCLKTRYIQV